MADRIKLTFFIFFSVQLITAQAAALENTSFTSFDSNAKTFDLQTQKGQGGLLVVTEDCSTCTKLIKKLEENCQNFNSANITVLSSGSKEKLKNKLNFFLKNSTPTYFSTDYKSFKPLRISAVPFYLSLSKKRLYGVAPIYKTLIHENTCTPKT